MERKILALIMMLCMLQAVCFVTAVGEDAPLIEQGNAAFEEGNYEKAMELYLASLEETEDPGAMFNIAVLYWEGKGTEKDAAKAAEWFEKAADKGLTDAMHNLGCMYLRGEGVEESHGRAVHWFRRAAEAGSAASMYNLGYMYVNGLGVDADAETAYAWFRKAEEEGYESAGKAMEAMEAAGLYEPDPYPCAGVTLRGDLEVKRMPTKNSPRDAVLRKDREVTVLSEEDGWYRISVDLDGTRNVEGYVPVDSVELKK